MRFLGAASFAALFVSAFLGVAKADDVTFTSRDGTFEVSGTLLGFDGTFYRVETIYGELTLDGTGVTCDGPGCPDLSAYVAEFDVSGARTLGDALMPALLEGFATEEGLRIRRELRDDTHFRYILSNSEREVARIGFRITTSDEGFADLLANEADMALSLREIRAGEVQRGREAGLGDLSMPGRVRVVALDGLVPIVSPSNTVHALTIPQLAAIYSGDITTWSVVGGAEAPISLHLRASDSGQAQAFEDRVMTVAGFEMTEAIARHASNAELSDAVAADPFALGVTSFAEIGNAQAVSIAGNCGFSVDATRATLKTEDYPLSAPLLLYLPARRLPQIARDFLRYLRSPKAQIITRRLGFVDQAPLELPMTVQGDRLASAIAAAGTEVSLAELQAMVDRLKSFARLTSTFRFTGGSTELDPQSQSNVAQLARDLEAGLYDDRELLFVGFSDGEGAADVNKRLSRERARRVRDAVIRAAPTADRSRLEMRVAAFGEAMPMACDETVWERKVNRRVEVWVR